MRISQNQAIRKKKRNFSLVNMKKAKDEKFNNELVINEMLLKHINLILRYL